jgi:hypothetical protein
MIQFDLIADNMVVIIALPRKIFISVLSDKSGGFGFVKSDYFTQCYIGFFHQNPIGVIG